MNKILETDRLILRELKLNDKDELAQILSDKESMKYYTHPFSDEEVVNWINRNINNYKTYSHGLWAVLLKGKNTFIGDCGITIQQVEGENIHEIGYHIKKEYWNKGYATEAARACKDYAFNILNIDKIYSYTKVDNCPSRKVAEKVGMKFIKNFTKNISGEEVEEVLYYVQR